ncbi:solute carrier family 35 member F5-like isoform X2 [Hippocampus zosterae]|uniref:solute carrier family 35 member F5-like isoform X2 n=1 Tax=Hippocampus zosterae TaxID=109293 RepID=UPI00223E1B79|nr:solute carrier family 35 member F5-like isoform X2 [Hippocampus zosterae]
MECMFIMNRMGSAGSSAAAQRRRMALGVVILLLVDVIWVASSELTAYIFRQQEYNKPFFSTFAKTSMFVLYLLGFLLWRPWRRQCTGSLKRRRASLFADAEAYFAPCANDAPVNNRLSEPLYVPVKFQDVPADPANCLMDASRKAAACKKQRVRFSNIMEVRQLPSTQALEAKLSRMSYPAAKDHEAALRTAGKLTVADVAKISFFFCFVWFLANLSYQEALSARQVAIVNVLSSTSGMFTLILAAVFPSSSSDRFTLSKLFAVALSMGGVATVSLSGTERPDEQGTVGSLWSLAGAVLYAVYVVMIKRWVDREDKLDIPMFFGFVGLFNLLLLWPGFLLLHYTGFEAFELPSQLVWAYILVNGLIGTVLSEFLWLWGCFLTSSLIGTLALSLTIPLSILADIFMQKVRFSWTFFAGAVPVFLSFFITTLLCHYNNWDPVMVGLRRLYAFVFRRHRAQRLPDDQELCESLLPLHAVSLNQGSS